jgi:hypothetical protein
MRACAALLVPVACLPALAAQKCETGLARLESADKRLFTVERYGSGLLRTPVKG